MESKNLEKNVTTLQSITNSDKQATFKKIHYVLKKYIKVNVLSTRMQLSS